MIIRRQITGKYAIKIAINTHNFQLLLSKLACSEGDGVVQ
jgi:hypothetical protein